MGSGILGIGGSDSSSNYAPNYADTRGQAPRGNANVTLQDNASYANLQGSKITTAPAITAAKGSNVTYSVTEQTGLSGGDISNLLSQIGTGAASAGPAPPVVTDVSTPSSTDTSTTPPASTPSPTLLSGGLVVLAIIVGGLFFLLRK